jgi:hypothetical protein
MSKSLVNLATLRALKETDSGDNGFWPDVTSAAHIHRLRDRLFINDGAAFTGNRYGTQSGFVPTGTEGANWAPRDSTLFVAQSSGLMAVTGFASNADMNLTAGEPTETIGVSGFVIGNKTTRSVWGLYSDVQFETGNYGYGIEIAIKNKEGVDRTSTPYFATTGTYGIWMPAGGDSTYGGSPTHPNNTAIAIGKGSSTWNKGIVFFADGLTGTDGVTGIATAIEMARGHSISWRAPGNYAGFSIRSDVSGTANTKSITASDSYINLVGNAGAPIFLVKDALPAANYVAIESAQASNLCVFRLLGTDTNVGMIFVAKGTQSFRFTSQNSGTNDEFRIGGVNSAPVNFLRAYGTNSGSGLAVLDALGTDTNISIRLAPKGTGTVSFGTWTSNADAAVNGYVTITDSSGNTRKLATIA